jgi:SAM-dependent methyltransferase
MGGWTRAVGATFLEWVAPPAGARWLDVGCGTGIFTELVLDTCSPATMIAVDPSEAQIELTRGKPIAQRADFRIADAQSLPFPDGAFDVVVSALVINFISDRRLAVVEMRRVARQGGAVSGYVWDFAAGGSPVSSIRAALGRIGAEPPPVPGMEDSGLTALSALFEGAGFDDIATRTIDVRMTFRNFDEYWRTQTPTYSPTGKVIASLSQSDRGGLMELVRTSMPAGPDGSIGCSARANAIKALVPG